MRIAGPAATEYVWVTFAPDGDSIYYLALDRDQGDTELYRVPVAWWPAQQSRRATLARLASRQMGDG